MSVLVPRHDPLYGRSKQEYLCLLRQALRGRVHAAYLFGSLARGERANDVDLILVCETEEPFPDRARAFWDLQDLAIPTDILVYTPDEWRKLAAQPKPLGFWHDVLRDLEPVLSP